MSGLIALCMLIMVEFGTVTHKGNIFRFDHTVVDFESGFRFFDFIVDKLRFVVATHKD